MSTGLISKKDVDLLEDHLDDIIKEAKKKQMMLIEPHEDEIKDISNIILNYVKKYKRKIYGGYALNLLIIDKNPKDAIYTEDDIPDIDFYSPEPLEDLVRLCDTIYQAGYKYVMGREALHKETYSIRVRNQLYCDISYVPKIIYNRMPFREINGLYVIGPDFMMIDYYRMLTDLTSYWRLDKAIKRFYLLQKYYPLPYIKSSIDIPPSSSPQEVNKLLNLIFNFIQNKNTIIIIGFYAYNHFLKNSGILNANTQASKKFKYLEVPYYEIIATEYKIDSLSLINTIKKTYPEFSNDIHVIENYPFFTYFGYSVNIYYKKTLIAKIFNHNKRCVPYITVPADQFGNKTIVPSKNDDVINIGTLSTVILYSLVTIMKARVDQDQSVKDTYYAIISHLVEMKNYYFNKTGKTIYDETIFQDFQIMNCKGAFVTAEMERQLIIESRKKQNKKLVYSYDPSEEIKPEDRKKYQFLNSSGNPIKTPKNLKLTEEAKDDDIDEESQEQEEN